MASFDTHISVAAVSSGVLSSVCIHAGLTTFEQTLLLWLLGTLAGLLPDIDSDNSTSLNLLFHIGYFFLLSWLSFHRWLDLPLTYLWGAALLLYCALRFVLLPTFTRITDHRGHCHSLLATLVFALATVVFCHRILEASVPLSWLAGLFTTVGVLTHLLLDEWAAIDWRGLSLKKSLGTALKPVRLADYPVLALLVGALAGLWWLAPAHEPALRLYSELWQRLSHSWYG